ncbi:Alpha/Beta hydrolase protein [Circinella umbellata]|nr:Alpha/Beta hydrolase protein [Circinella umbellata]
MLIVQNNDSLQNNTAIFSVAADVPAYPVEKKGPTLLRRSPSRGGSSSPIHSHHSDQQPSPPQQTLPQRKRISRTYTQRISIQITQFISSVLTLSILTVICTMAFAQNAYRTLTERGRVAHPDEDDCPKEKIVPDECYYIKRWGYEPRIYNVITEDGYILRMYRIIAKDKKSNNGSKKLPVLLGHGLFQCGGDFLANEDKSMAFVLADQGYDVWIGNTRAAGSFDHISLSHEDPEYWAWGLKELAIYDWPTMIDCIREETDFHKIAYIGHSQGNAMAFVGLKLRPEIAEKLSCFIALAPAVFSGTLTSTFPLKQLIGLNKYTYSLIFGSGAFIPVMTIAQRVVHPVIFAHMAYSMFAYLFSWWDTHWLRRRKPKYFQFTPRPVSSQLISDWMEGWGKRGVLMYISEAASSPVVGTITSSSSSSKTVTASVTVPLTIFYGTDDYLVDGERLVQTFDGYENYGRRASPQDIPFLKATASTGTGREGGSGKSSLFPMLNLVRAYCIDEYEHMDTIFGYDNVITTYPGVIKALSSAHWNIDTVPS